MIVGALHLERVAVLPDEAEPPLVVDADAELSRAISVQGLQAVTWRDPQILEAPRLVQLPELAPRGPLQVVRQAPNKQPPENRGSHLVGEALYHTGE